jgi:hypothetical protein
VSPITGELIALEDMAEHMRISLIDPRWKEQREAMMSKIRCAEDYRAVGVSMAKAGRGVSLLAKWTHELCLQSHAAAAAAARSAVVPS